ncbi:bacillithiol biosynthesis cysteine-adding enzyme BshC [Olivibacter sitiensis]|uniref:bacillithiol biosynthesis cysteine-adding enzyme BshC n=1 Tax=Olivibacter sitiensis TaxID=376470 RepID=UPI000421E934|nr:bacillithiol biosynthesis cysteine-adding enzyme BshC [Olivibacter sitiensis]
MKATYINYSDTNSFSKTLIDYIAKDKKLSPFYGHYPALENFGKQITDRKKVKVDRGLLASELLKQYGQTLHDGELVKANIEKLKSENTFTITTGHQLNIFTGPLYFIFKIASTIKLCQDLAAQYPDCHFVPVYWMATEDHDFPEINHTTLLNENIKWDTNPVSATGRMNTASMARTVRKYQRMLGVSPNADKLAYLTEKAYLEHKCLSDATRYLVHGLFKEFGLVIVDADRKVFKDTFKDIMKKDILEQHSFEEIAKTTKQLEKLGYEPQVHAREINFFYLTDEYRERIIKDGEKDEYQVLNTDITFSASALQEEIDQHPERFSPNVVMRPLYQEVLLPNLCYIGGGAEVAYWLQLKSNFQHYGIPFPMLLPRNSAVISNENLDYKVFKLNLSFKSIFKNTDELKKEYVRIHSKNRLNLLDEWNDLNDIFERIKDRIGKIDATLKPSTEAIKTNLHRAIQNLEKKMVKADKQNFDNAIHQIDHIKEALFPNGVLQERNQNFGLLYVKYGDQLIRELIHVFRPLDMKFTILY